VFAAMQSISSVTRLQGGSESGELALMLIALKLLHKDPVKRALFQNHGTSDVASASAIQSQRNHRPLLSRPGPAISDGRRPDSLLFGQGMEPINPVDSGGREAISDKAGDRRNAGGTRLAAEGQPVRITVNAPPSASLDRHGE